MATLYVYDEIGPAEWGLVSARGIADELAGLDPQEPVDVRINSPGGNVFEALAIREQLIAHAGSKTFHVDALAASAASFLPTPGATVRAAEASFVMIHSPWTLGIGNASELRKQADLLDNIEGQLVGIYQQRTGLEASQIAEMLAAETWLNATDALEMGFIDEINAEQQAIAACIRPGMFEHVPQALLDDGESPQANRRVEAASQTIRTGRIRKSVHEARKMRLGHPYYRRS